MQHLNKTYQIGSATVTRIDEIPLPNVVPSQLYPDLDAGASENYGRFLTDGSYDRNTGTLTLSIHTWLVRFFRYNILVDTGVGNSKTVPDLPQFDHLDSPYLERLIAAGVQAEEVEFVLMTHLHLDHVGRNTR
jgi:glyoxylase-like metal-dependent hydrolase (beta-lactamase superfamily II)